MSGSLSKSANFVADAFHILPAVFYTPEDIVLGQYSFVPYARTGLSAAIQSPAAGQVRGTVAVGATLQGAPGEDQPIGRTLVLRGPGDVTGIDGAQVIRRVPQPGTVNAEESFIAQIEFDRPEMPWLFSPFAPDGDKVLPWLALIVCELGLATFVPGGPGLPQQVIVPLSELPSLRDSWAWAHAQVVGAADGGGPTVADRLSDDHAPANLSRIVCPRKLDPDRTYVACLVPAFDAGVQAGLGKGGGTLAPAWDRAADPATQVVLPCYDTWQFGTADAGDFRSLAERLTGVVAPWQIGRRIIDASQPGGGVAALAGGDPGALQVLRCALVSPTPMPPGEPPETAGWTAAKRDELRQVVDRASAAGHEDLPRVGPRLYARFQRAQSTIGPAFGAPPADAAVAAADHDWFTQLNTHPMHRVVAGLGTRVAQKDQELLMQAAWAQIGEIDKANAALRAHQFARYVGEALQQAHFAPLNVGTLAQVLRGVQGKLRLSGAGLTVKGQVGISAVAPAAMSAAYRRATRMRGPVARLTDAAGRATLGTLVASKGTFRDFQRPYVEPGGIAGLSAKAMAAIPAAIIARKLGVAEGQAAAELTRRLSARQDVRSIADRVLAPLSSWRVSDGTLDLGAAAAAQVSVLVDAATPADAKADPGRSEALAAILVGVANSGIGAAAEQATARVRAIHLALGFSQAPAVPVSPAGTGLKGLPQILTPAAPRSIGTSATTVPTRTVPIPTRPIQTVPIQTVPVQAGPVLTSLPPLQRFETDVSRTLAQSLTQARATPLRTVAQALSDLVLGAGVQALPGTAVRPALMVTAASLLKAIDPAATMSAYVQGRLVSSPSWLPKDWFINGRIEPIMAAPRFDRPMYEALDAYGRDWLVPGLGTVGKTDFVTLLETNPAFTEAFLAGLSDEMGRELLWRGYPTDQRGTYFRRFWDHDQDELKSDLHLFDSPPPATALGTHLKTDGGEHGHLVLVVRGELVRRYPHAIMAAVLAEADDGKRPVFTTITAGTQFHVHLPPDYILVGFRLTAEQVRSSPWWFILAEHPTAPRFGLELPPGRDRAAAASPFKHDDAAWGDLGPLEFQRFLSARARTADVTDPLSLPPTITWPGSAATVARTLFRNPVRAAFNGKKLIAPAGAPGGANV